MPRFEWSGEKARRNLAKHGVSFDDAALVWSDPGCLIYPEPLIEGEERWHALGLVWGKAMLLVVHTYPADDDDDWVRIISARRAVAVERRRYGQGDG